MMVNVKQDGWCLTDEMVPDVATEEPRLPRTIGRLFPNETFGLEAAEH